VHGPYDEFCEECADFRHEAKKTTVGGFIIDKPCTDTYSRSQSTQSTQASLATEVARELTRAQSLFPPIHSPHEGLAVIEEEWEEFKKEVWAFNLNKGRDTRPKMRAELIQLAAMCLRTINDTIDKDGQ
jgi:hypothetical protein